MILTLAEKHTDTRYRRNKGHLWKSIDLNHILPFFLGKSSPKSKRLIIAERIVNTP